MTKDSSEYPENLLKLYDLATYEAKNPYKKFSRLKKLVNQMDLSNQAHDKIIKIIIEDIGL